MRSAAPSAVSEHTTSTKTFAEAYRGEAVSYAICGEPGGALELEVQQRAASLKGRTGSTASAFLLANTILGIGLLGLPTVCGATGAVAFVLFLGLSCTLAWFTCHLMVQSSQLAREKAFVSVGEAAFGRPGAYAASAIMICQTFCTLTAYVVLIKDMAPDLVWKGASENGLAKVMIVISFVIVLLLPLCLLKDISKLSFTAKFAVAVFMAVVGTVIYSNFTDPDFGDGDGAAELAEAAARPAQAFRQPGSSMLSKIPSMLFAFVCHHTVLPIYSDLRSGEPRLMDKVAFRAFSSAMFLYLLCGIGGYFAFRDAVLKKPVDGNILMAFPEKVQFRALRMAMLVAVLLGYPCVHFGSRKAVTYVVFGPDGEWTLRRHVAITLCIVGATTLTALKVPDLKFAFAWAGSTAAIIMMYVYPAVTYLALWRRLPQDRMTRTRVICARLVLAWGILMMCILITNNILHPPGAKEKEEEVHRAEE